MARRTTVDPAVPGDRETAPVPGDVASELAVLRRSVDRLEQGLTQLAEATATHTELLRALLAATTAPTKPEHELAEVLAQVVARLGEQSGLLRAIGATMTRLPEDVGGAVGRQVAAALSDLR
jgi:hypothetical protein